MITLIVSAVVLVTLISMYFAYNNREVSLRKEAEAQKGKIESVYDTMWKTLKQEAGVTEQYRKTF
jgi:Tfp pilus assembly protein PilW